MHGMPNMLRIGATIVICAVALIWMPSLAEAQARTWPQRPVKFVVPLGPGAGVDITARLLGDRPAAQDDHTLLISPTSSFTHHPWMYDKLPYDPGELVPIARVTNTLVAIVVPASSPINSLADLLAAARAEPGRLNWATVTGMFDFFFEGFQKKGGW